MRLLVAESLPYCTPKPSRGEGNWGILVLLSRRHAVLEPSVFWQMFFRFIIADEIANGILGSLVAITATCACVHPPEAPLIGAVGGILALLTNDWTLGRVL